MFKKLTKTIKTIFICSVRGHKSRWLPDYKDGIFGKLIGYKKICTVCGKRLSSKEEESFKRKKIIKKRRIK